MNHVAPFLRHRSALPLYFWIGWRAVHMRMLHCQQSQMLVEQRLEVPVDVKLPQQGDNDAMRHREPQHRTDDDSDDLQIWHVRLKGVHSPRQDKRLGRFPYDNGEVEAGDDCQLPTEWFCDDPESADDFGEFISPL